MSIRGGVSVIAFLATLVMIKQAKDRGRVNQQWEQGTEIPDWHPPWGSKIPLSYLTDSAMPPLGAIIMLGINLICQGGIGS